MRYDYSKANLKGPLFTVASAIFLTSGLISIKYLLNFTNPVTLNFLWMGSALLIAIVIADIKQIRWLPVIKKHWNVGFVLGALIGIGSILMFYAINSIGPSLSSFLVRFSMVFTVILGIIFLKERLTSFEVLGMLIAILGVFTISFIANGMIQLGSLFVIVAAFFFAINGIVSKIYVKRINPLELIILRDIFAVSVVLLYGIVSNKLQPVPFNVIGLTLLLSSLSVTGFLLFLRALQLMDLTKVIIIRTLDPFLVVVYSFIFFHAIPSFMQMIGGSIIVLGVIMIVAKHQIKKTADVMRLYSLKFIGR